jgi:signal transduction histidine kinase
MRSELKDRYLPLGLGVAIVAVLAILAVLQYRWSNQVSEANETQIGTTLQASMTDWHFDLFRELSTIAVSLQVGPDSGARDDWQDYLGRYREWRDASGSPEVVRDVLIWETSAAPASRLLRLDPEKRSVEACPTPEDLAPLLARLATSSSSLAAGLTAWSLAQGNGSGEQDNVRPSNTQFRRSDPVTGWQFDARVPALVHPIVHHRLPGETKHAIGNAVDWIIVSFDLPVLRGELLPELTRRYFGTEQGQEYRIAVLARAAPHVIYDSEPEAGENARVQPDAEMPIFGAPPESTEGQILHGPRAAVSAARSNWRRLPGPAWFPVIQYGGEDQAWDLVVQHRSGSLAAMIAAVRDRNLTISFGVLALLAVSMGLVVLASYRAQRFAKLQMNFVTGISHELRTPLAVIASAAENIMDGVVGEKQLVKYGNAIHKQAQQLTALVEQILHFAASQNGGERYQFRLLTPQEIVHAAVESTRDLLDKEGFNLELATAADLPSVRGDLFALSQCLQNLIVNAVKYSGASRWIGIVTKTAVDTNGRTEVQITVQDRGVGIPGGEVEHIFEPFYRTQAAREAQAHGTGLGLTLARTIAEEMEGKLTVVTKLEQGSAFTVHLPAAAHPTGNVESTADAPQTAERR